MPIFVDTLVLPSGRRVVPPDAVTPGIDSSRANRSAYSARR